MEDLQTDLVIFQEAGRPVEVRLDVHGDTVWLTQRQMSVLFDTTPENVLMHLKNIFKDKELREKATTKDFLAVQTEGNRRVQRHLKHFNLDAAISVGYRVNSKRAVLFRQCFDNAILAAVGILILIDQGDLPVAESPRSIDSSLPTE